MWVFADFFFSGRKGSSGIVADGLVVERVDEGCNFNIGQFFVKGEQGVHVNLQQSRQCWQQGNVRHADGAFPFVHCWCSDTKHRGDLFLSETVFFTIIADLFGNVHSGFLLWMFRYLLDSV